MIENIIEYIGTKQFIIDWAIGMMGGSVALIITIAIMEIVGAVKKRIKIRKKYK